MSELDAVSKQVFVNDGDTIIVVARTQQVGPTVSDPCDASPYLSQAYRVVSDRVGATLALVPLGARAVRVSQNEIDHFVARESRARQEKVNQAMDEILELVKRSGWKFAAPIIERLEHPLDPVAKSWNNQPPGRCT